MPKCKAPCSSSDSDTGPDDPPSKKKKPQTDEKNKGSGKKGPNDEVMYQLGKSMRYATVSEFRGKVLVSIREYYQKDGEIMPGKKGISLNVDQWNALKDVMDDVDNEIRKHQSG